MVGGGPEVRFHEGSARVPLTPLSSLQTFPAEDATPSAATLGDPAGVLLGLPRT